MTQRAPSRVVANIRSGKQDDADREKRIRAAFEDRETESDFKAIQNGGRLATEARRAVDQGYSTVVAAGGAIGNGSADPRHGASADPVTSGVDSPQ
ncbi:MAG: hypothetical protein NXI19_05415 [Alphaproteobacteria bacterium]|nr:hypothetical protein [Alphaproteobacteria bacterium]